jgi:hypothetical protein
MRIAGTFGIYFTGSEVSFACPSCLLWSPFCPSDAKKYLNRFLPGLLRHLWRAWADIFRRSGRTWERRLYWTTGPPRGRAR